MPQGKRKVDEAAAAKAAVKRVAKVAEKVEVSKADNSASTCAINAKLQAHLAACDAKIKDEWKDLMTLPHESHSGSGIPFYDAIAATRLLSSHQTYVCAAPLYWLNTGFELQPNVPKYRKRLDNLKEHFFSEPTALTQMTLVRLSPGEIPHKMQGSLKASDLTEMRDALRLAVAEALEGKLSKKEKQAWKDALLAIPFRFEAGWVWMAWGVRCFFKKIWGVSSPTTWPVH